MLNATVSLPPPDDYEKPRFSVSRGACDSHAHVISQGAWKVVPEATYTPAPAPAATHLRMLDTLGLDRGVVVQPSIFGTDNSAVLDAIARAAKRLLGVAVLAPSVFDHELNDLHEQGIRGVRFNVMLGGGGGLAAMTELAPRLASLGWHAEILVDGDLLPQVHDALKALASNVAPLLVPQASQGLNGQLAAPMRALATAKPPGVRLPRAAAGVSGSRQSSA